MDKRELLSALEAIDPKPLAYQDWLNVGFALKSAGCDVSDWKTWSQRDPRRYDENKLIEKWQSANGSGITEATIFHLAKERGWKAEGKKQYKKPRALEEDEVLKEECIPSNDKKMSPAEQLFTYLTTLFENNEYLDFAVEAQYDEERDKYTPCKHQFRFKVSSFLGDLQETGNVDQGFCSYNHEAGAWCSLNPVDGEGAKKSNVTRWDYALVECDNIPIEQQYSEYKRLNLPIATLVSSGKKSLHAAVKVNATSLEEFNKRVGILFDYLKEQGLELDEQNKNCNRLSRMPGFQRGDKVQELLAVNIGAKNWDEWQASISQSDKTELPPFHSLRYDMEHPKSPRPEVIHGLLRQGAKLMMAGEQKIGKTWAVIQLGLAVATGGDWFGFQCEKGKVLYMNFEVEEGERQGRTKKVLEAWGKDNRPFDSSVYDSFITWDLRGYAVPVEEMEHKIIERCSGQGFSMIIVDPIYKLNGGDENSAGDTTKFLNSLERIAVATGACIVFSHHHSKGAGQKASMERFSGSGVFLRDPDAIIDVSELNISDDAMSRHPDFVQVEDKPSSVRAFRLSFSVRSFRPIDPMQLWFSFPLHYADRDGVLDSAKEKGSQAANLEASPKRQNSDKRKQYIEDSIRILLIEGMPTTYSNIIDKCVSEFKAGQSSAKRYLADAKEEGRIKVRGNEYFVVGDE